MNKQIDIRVFTTDEIKKNIEKLFVTLCPNMVGLKIAERACYKNVNAIVDKFNKHLTDFNKLLVSLSALDGIGLVLSSGLIFIAYQNSAVPFDRYTMGFSIKEGILQTPIISNGNYVAACLKVIEYIENHPTINNIHEFVLKAGELDSVLTIKPV